eukprot:129079-Prymnesium_polylepis.1
MMHARSIITIYKRERDKRRRRVKRDGDGDTWREAETRRALVQLPRRDRHRARAKETMVAMPMAAKQQ